MDRPLAGVRTVVTRPRAQAPALCSLLRQRGAVPLVFPTIEVVPVDDPVPLDRAIASLPSYDWIVFTSVNGVDAFFTRLGAGAVPPAVRTAAIGPATAQALSRWGAAPAVVPDEHVAERIADVVGDAVGRRFLLPRAASARRDLTDLLRERGARVDDVAVYETVAGRPTPKEFGALRSGVDVITFTSSSTVRYFLELVPDGVTAFSNALIACIGPITAAAARERGLPVSTVAATYTTEGLVEALVGHFTPRQPATS